MINWAFVLVNRVVFNRLNGLMILFNSMFAELKEVKYFKEIKRFEES